MEKWRTDMLINEAYHWRKEGGFASASEAGSCYNADRNEIYYFNRDSLFVYNMETGKHFCQAFAERCPVKLVSCRQFSSIVTVKVYAYEVYTENGDSEPMIASLDLHTLLEGGELQSAEYAIASSLFLL